MLLDISHIGQIGFGVADIDRAEDFYGRALGLRKLFRFGDLTFFDCGGIRLLLEKRRGPGDPMHGGTIYLRCADLALAVEELRARGVTFSLGPHLIARMDDHDLWMAFFLDPDGNSLALMQEAPRGIRKNKAANLSHSAVSYKAPRVPPLWSLPDIQPNSDVPRQGFPLRANTAPRQKHPASVHRED